jgi:DNA-binding SARP family transcriptional activator
VPAKVRVPVTDALPRERLEARLGEAFGRRLTLVVAPAGSGKTTLVARFATTCGVPVAWYRAETWDADEASFVRHLEASLVAVVPDLAGGWLTVEDAARSLAIPAEPARVLLVIDDFHALEDTAAEAAFGRLVDWAPAWLTLVLASRVAPGVNLSRLRVSGELLEIGTDDLRFRAWEVEQLFREVYHDPVPPADLAVLARRTEGWAAGLQLFHLATRGRSAEERRRVLGGPGSSGRLLREYLAQNVMIGLPVALREFLLDTCVLGRLSGSLCDRLRGTSGSGALLDELARRGVFTVPVEDGTDAYRYHEVLRQHLDRMLVEAVGESVARERHAAAGRLLESYGALPEALRAYCRAEDWDEVRRLLGGQGERLAASEAGGWIEALPPAIERHDPWVALAAARRARNDGRWAAAIAAYAHAEAEFGPARAADAPRRERLALAAWTDPSALPTADASGVLRAGLGREPVAVARDHRHPDDPAMPVARGLLALAAGDVATARRVLRDAADGGEPGLVATAAARLGSAVAGVLAGEPPDARVFDRAVEEAERAGSPWLARLGRDLGRRLGAGGSVVAGRVSRGDAMTDGWAGAASAMRADDGGAMPVRPLDDAAPEPWAEALLALASAWSAPGGPEEAIDRAEAAGDAFRRLGAGVPEAWSRAIAALAAGRVSLPDSREAAIAAESLGRATGTPGARAIAHAALAGFGDVHAPDHRAFATAVLAETGLALPRWARPVGAALSAVGPGPGTGPAAGDAAGDRGAGRHRVGPPVRVRLLGGCVLEVDGRRLQLDGAKPRVRSLLRLLALHAGAPVHREVIQEALWPDADADAGARSLHVALSALRRLLDEIAAPLDGRLVVREGDAYRLDVGTDDVDVGRFERAVTAGRAARARGGVAAAAFTQAIDLYVGDLLPEEGPADWVSESRDHCRARAVEAAQGLAEEALLAGDHAMVVRACRFGLELDRYQDAFWRMLILARERAGDAGAATRDRREYAQVLEALGVDVPLVAGPS